MMSKQTPRFVVLAMAAAATVFVAGCTGKQDAAQGQAAAQARPATPVSVQVIEYTEAIVHTELAGRVTAYETAEVRPQVSGILQKRLFEEGAEVKLGQPLYQIDPAIYEAQVASAKASLLQARATLASAQADAKRSAELVKVNAVSKSADDAAQAAYKVAVANVEAAKAALTSAQINLRYTKVNSPIAGKVSLSEVTPGALVTSGQAQRLTVVQQIDPVYVDVTQSQSEIARLRQQAKKGVLRTGEEIQTDVQLILDNGTTYPKLGKLTFKDALVDESTGTVRIRAVFSNPDRDLMPGMYVRARLVDGILTKAIKLDQRATMRRNNGTPYVYVVDKDNKIESRDIEITGSEGNYWIVEKGLEPGEKVVVEGLQKVAPGATVAPGAPLVSKVGPDSATVSAPAQASAQTQKSAGQNK